MMNNQDIIKTQFKKFSEKYGFSVMRELSSPEYMGNALVTYTSDIVGIEIVVDRDQVLVTIGKISWPEERWFEFTDVINYFAPDEDPYIFWDQERNVQIDVETQVKRIIHLLEQHCGKLLEGDFSSAVQIKDLERRRVTEMLVSFSSISKKERGK